VASREWLTNSKFLKANEWEWWLSKSSLTPYRVIKPINHPAYFKPPHSAIFYFQLIYYLFFPHRIAKATFSIKILLIFPSIPLLKLPNVSRPLPIGGFSSNYYMAKNEKLKP